jgi:hypothetical protein
VLLKAGSCCCSWTVVSNSLLSSFCCASAILPSDSVVHLVVGEPCSTSLLDEGQITGAGWTATTDGRLTHTKVDSFLNFTLEKVSHDVQLNSRAKNCSFGALQIETTPGAASAWHSGFHQQPPTHSKCFFIQDVCTFYGTVQLATICMQAREIGSKIQTRKCKVQPRGL